MKSPFFHTYTHVLCATLSLTIVEGCAHREVAQQIHKLILYYISSLQISVTLRELGLANPEGYAITDLFDGVHYGTVLPDKRFKVDVNPSGVVLVRCEVAKHGGRTNFRQPPSQSTFRNPFNNNNLFNFG